ncbi:hypothetical protein MKW98_028750 [Papaver atlanticum]|uniref:MATH domain-containing protein n=1 Tax=Papaver atlanticum TaxID=357466 RepID=A0AAD4SAB6_9MAGN|nr:hypothetical protein MKW98_028750 [Papaver atlanticum]
MSTSASSNKYVWKIENFSSLSSKTHYSEVFSASCGVDWQLSIDPKGRDGTYKTLKGAVARWNGTRFVIGLAPWGTGSWYVEFSLSIINQKDRKKTRKYVAECEMRAKSSILGETMRLTELLHPKKGFIIDDVCYIKVEIICVMEIVKSLQVPIKEEKTTDSREKKEIPPGGYYYAKSP